MAEQPKTSIDYLNEGRVTNNEFDGKYSVTNLTYPSDLLKDPAQGQEADTNYVVFFINVSEDSKIIKEGKVQTIDTANVSPRTRGELIGRNTRNGVNKDVAAGSAVGAGILSDIAANTIGINIGGAGTKVGVISAASLELTGNEIGSFTRPMRRLQTAIALHVPNQLNIRYSTNWSEDQTSLFTYATTGGAEMGKILEDAQKYYLNQDHDTLTKVQKGGTVAQQILAANLLNASSGLSASTGLAQNPNKEQIFEGVDFRTFTMDYQFTPRNESEKQNVLNIIQQFKYHMHPEFKDSNNFIYIYPSEFDIAYYKGSKENTSLHRHTSCVLRDISVNYTPNGMFGTFKDGTPPQINVTLTFLELAQLTKEQIRQGF